MLPSQHRGSSLTSGCPRSRLQINGGAAAADGDGRLLGSLGLCSSSGKRPGGGSERDSAEVLPGDLDLGLGATGVS